MRGLTLTSRGSRTPTPAAYLFGVLLAATLGLALRVAYADQRIEEPPPRRGGWRSVAQIPAPYTKVAWTHDEYLYYLSTAINGFEGRGFVPDYNTVRDGIYVPPPMQSLLMLIVFKLAGRLVQPLTLLALQGLVAALMIVLTAEVGRRLVSSTAGVLAALLIAVHPDLVYWSAYLLTEANYLAGLVLLLYLLFLWAEQPTPVRALLPALCLGLLHLQRMNAALLGPLLAGFAFLILPRRRALGSAAIFLLVPVLVLLPWLFRNLRVYGEPIWVNSNAGIHFYVANHPGLDPIATPYLEDAAGGSLIPEIEARLRRQTGRLRVSYYRYSAAYLRAARDYLRQQPLHFFRNVAIKLANQFRLVQDLPRVAWPVLNDAASYTVLAHTVTLGGFAGLAVLGWRRPSRTLALAALVFACLAGMGGLSIAVKDGRYGLNPRYFLTLFLAAGAVTLLESLAGARRPAAPSTAPPPGPG